MIGELEEIMEYETAGDPMTGLKWTRKTTQKIADELSRLGVAVSSVTVGKILKMIGYSLKTNRKVISNGGKPLSKEKKEKSDRQFGHIKTMRENFGKTNCPAISVDTKKKELIGNFRNPGTRYKKEADLVNDHDFLNYGLGKAALYGVYDMRQNTGFVSIGKFVTEGRRIRSGDTPEFAVESIERWWREEGSRHYRNAKEMLILADAGGSNGYRPHMWKVKIQELICDRHGITVTVCHYPPGKSKWNPIEHRLFSEISKNWQGTPLTSYETVLNYTLTTKTATGLKVNAVMVDKLYEKGLGASKEDLKRLNIERHEINSEWNYTISPKC